MMKAIVLLVGVVEVAGCSSTSSPANRPDAAAPVPDAAVTAPDAPQTLPDAPQVLPDSAPLGPDAVPAPVVCGDGVRAGLEACDEGRGGGADCTPGCAIKTSTVTPFAQIDPQNGVWMTTTSTGITFVKQTSGGAGADSITAIAPGGTVTPNAVPGIKSQFGGDVISAGADLITGGVGFNGTDDTMSIQRWNPEAQTMTLLFEEKFANAGPYAGVAASADGARLWFFLGDVNVVTGMATSDVYIAGTGDFLLPIQLDRPADELIATDGADLLRETASGSKTFARIFSLPVGAIGKLTVDGAGRIFATCYDIDRACATGAVWIIAADASKSQVFLDASVGAVGLGWDATRNALIVLGDDWGLRRFSL